MIRNGWGITLLVIVALLMQNAYAGDLRKFAEKATNKKGVSSVAETPKKEADSANRSYHSAASAPFGSGTYPSDMEGQSFIGGFMAWLVTSPIQYRHDDPALFEQSQEDTDERRFYFPEHQSGEATVPYARFDYNWQYVDGNIDANDVRIELGYKPLAVHVRSTRYKDTSDGFELDINQYYGVVRYGGYRPDFLPGTFEAGIGLGACQLKTNDSLIGDESGIGFTFPLKYYPVDWCGIEFRPAWYTWVENRRVADYDISLSVGYRFIQLRGGYRWMKLEGDVFNDGSYAGISASF